MKTATVTARRPVDVAREVERLASDGCRTFFIRAIDHGGVLDLERLGAARYAAGLHSVVELKVDTPLAAAALR